MAGSALAEGNAPVSLDSPGAVQSYKPGDNVQIAGKAQSIDRLAILVLDAKGSVAYAAQPIVANGNFATQFRLNNNAAEGQYTIRIGAAGLAAPVDFTFKVSKNSESSDSSNNSGSTENSGNNQGGDNPGNSGNNNSGNNSNSGNKGSSTGTNAVSTTPAGGTAKAAEQDASNLKDIAGHWAGGSIKRLVALGSINGYPEGCFKPNNTITRAEFVTVLVKTFKLENKAGKTFSDTAAHWAKDYISTAVANGIVNGYNSAAFGPDDPITREQMAVMLVKTVKLAPAAGKTTFADSSGISGWAREAMAAVTQNGIMKGYPDNRIRSQSTATRAEAVTMIVNALDK